ncbi:class I adenylate-forming enzyme family protein [Ramlibacter sp.]|uniref:class I adenylate-forming enzyme family protein n=1 Tax=Ramlibacter sp. TaxID=1917967 RepID=UPI002FC6BDB2
MYLTQGLHRTLQRHSGKEALVHLDGCLRRRQSFAELVSSVARQAAELADHGVKAGERVALLAPNSDQFVQVLLACWWLGAVACPLNIRWSVLELADAVADSGAVLLLADESLAYLIPKVEVPVVTLEAFAAQARHHAEVPDTRTGGDALAAILYTGGTTGRAKGVMLSHANLWASCVARGAELPNSPDSVALLVAPMFHVAGLSRLVGQLVVGGTCTTLARFQPDRVLDAIEHDGVSDIVVVPTMLQALLDTPEFRRERVQGLTRVAFGAAPMPPDLLERALASLPNAEFFQAYGMTETAGAVCMNPPANHRAGARGGLVNSVGRAGLGAEILVTDEEGREVPRGDVGEVVLRGPMVMRGYWRQPETTQAAFRDGWLRTGDAGRMDESGHLFIVDRIKDMIISGGENVYSGEVETVLRSHAAVAQAAVVGVPDARWGESVHAVVVLRPGASAAGDALTEWCRARLAGYKCPRAFSFVPELPVSGAGKVLKSVLREQVRR